MKAIIFICIICLVIISLFIDDYDLQSVLKSFKPGFTMLVYKITNFKEEVIYEVEIIDRKDRYLLVKDKNTNEEFELDIVENLMHLNKKVVLKDNDNKKYEYIWEKYYFNSNY